VETDIESTAWTVGGTPVQVTGEHSYSDTLPSINLVFEPIEDVLVRVGYSEVMARAGLGSLLPNTNVSVSGGSRSVSSGNPALEPTRAAAYDLGLELYFDDESVLGLAVFYKDIETFVQTVRETKPYTATGLPIQVAVAACTAGPGYGAASGCTENVDWDVTSPINAPGGDLYGFELSYQTPFTFLPGFLSNFGFIGNFTYVQAEQDFLNSSGVVVATRSLLGLSQDTTSGTLYYEDDAFSARVSAVNRSGYLTNATGRNNNDREGTNGTTNIDASASYQLNDNIKFTLEALNLTDEVDDQWVDAAGNRLSYYHATGRQYYLGVQYKY
jgi:TonB-dependent receptor